MYKQLVQDCPLQVTLLINILLGFQMGKPIPLRGTDIRVGWGEGRGVVKRKEKGGLGLISKKKI